MLDVVVVLSVIILTIIHYYRCILKNLKRVSMTSLIWLSHLNCSEEKANSSSRMTLVKLVVVYSR